MLSAEEKQMLAGKAVQMRRNVVTMVGVGKPGHLGGAFSLAEIVAYLYFHRMTYSAGQPRRPDRDRFLLSKGHGVLIQYAALAEMGLIPAEELARTKSLGSMLQGHPDMSKTPGIEAVTGSLGQGLSLALGMALGLRIDGSGSVVYVVLGDGELSEGQLWEAAMAAATFKVTNLVAILDRNRIQASGTTAEIFEIPAIQQKWEAFGWHVVQADGHDLEAIDAAFIEADKLRQEKPVMIVAHTVKGKGASFAEDNPAFHNGILTEELYKQALEELQQREMEAVR